MLPGGGARRAAIVIACAATIAYRGARAQEPPKAYFYQGYDYGTQSLYNPFYVLLNRGFDTLQLRDNHNIFQHPYLVDARNVAENVVNPTYNLEQHGWGSFVTQEVLPSPTTYSANGARWLPNYGLHLVGGGQSYAMLREWFEARRAPFPAAFSVATVYTAAFINEIFENRLTQGPNADAIADLLVFDLAGIVLFSFDSVKRFFSTRVMILDWSLQPVFALPKGGLHNVGSYYAIKVPVPRYERLRAFGYMGEMSLVGLSYKVGGEYSISAGAGGRIERVENALIRTDLVVSIRPAFALFVDRNESLLASLHVADIRDYFIHVNLYPNAIGRTDPGIGLFAVVGREGQWLTGVSFTRSLGFGVGAGTL